MPRFLIDVPHGDDQVACTRAIQVLLTSGSHFLANADWGCLDGEHRAWLIVEVDTKDEARGIVPPAFRSQAHVVELTKFSVDPTSRIVRRHDGKRTE